MSKIVYQLSELNEVVPEGITFSLLGYESLTGQWQMEFHAMDKLDFMPALDAFEYRVTAENFMDDIEINITRFIEAYREYLSSK